MKFFYATLFWIFFSAFVGAGIHVFCSHSLSLFKDVCLPLAALLFTAGQLWRAEKDREFEREKHVQRRKDQYWDKRLDYYVRLRELVGTILYDFSIQDIKDATSAGVMKKFQETKDGKIYRVLMELEFEGEILFTGVVGHIGEIRKNFEIIRKKEIEIGSKQQLSGGYGNAEQLAAAQTAKQEEAAKQAADAAFKECKEKISPYLRQEQ